MHHLDSYPRKETLWHGITASRALIFTEHYNQHVGWQLSELALFDSKIKAYVHYSEQAEETKV